MFYAQARDDENSEWRNLYLIDSGSVFAQIDQTFEANRHYPFQKYRIVETELGEVFREVGMGEYLLAALLRLEQALVFAGADSTHLELMEELDDLITEAFAVIHPLPKLPAHLKEESTS